MIRRAALLRALRRLELRPDQVRVCRRCGCFAYAVDAYQRGQLDALGFTSVCPDCTEEVRP